MGLPWALEETEGERGRGLNCPVPGLSVAYRAGRLLVPGRRLDIIPAKDQAIRR